MSRLATSLRASHGPAAGVRVLNRAGDDACETTLTVDELTDAWERGDVLPGGVTHGGGSVTGYVGGALERPVSPWGLLRDGLENNPDGLALISRDTRWTWRTLDNLSVRLAVSLLGLGLKPGDRVASLMPNCPALIVHYLACFKAGLVATPLNYRYMAPEIDHALGVSQARALVAHVERERDLAASQLTRQLPLGTISYGGKPGAGPALDELIEGDAPSSPPPPSPAAPAVIFFTSGSTGPPKGVTHTHETLGWMFATAAAGLELSPEDLLLAGSSLSHVGAFYVSFAALSVGVGVIVAGTFDADELLPLLREDRPTVLSMLPSALFALTRDHGARQDDFASLRLCRGAGDTVSAELEREFTALSGFAIDEAYGLTETGLVTVSPPSGRIKVGSVGQVVPEVSLSIRDDEGKELSPGSEGRLWIKTRAATVGYWGDPGATEAAFSNGWLDSGDVMRVDDEGFFSFCGRKKQIIVHDGSNICPQEVEGALLEHPSVASAGVIGLHDLVHGEDVRAYITLTEDTERPTSQELIQFARARVGYKAPEEIVVLDEMPVTATGKLDRTYLKRMAEANLARGANG